MTPPIVLPESPEAAKLVTVSGWMSRHGHIYHGDDAERAARWDGCTHRECMHCGTPAMKGYAFCPACRDANSAQKYLALPEAEWDGEAVLYSETQDRYYASPDNARDWMQPGRTIDGLRLVICVPQFASLEVGHFEDILSDEDGAPEELEAAIEAFNAAMKGLPVSWVPGETRLKIEGAE